MQRASILGFLLILPIVGAGCPSRPPYELPDVSLPDAGDGTLPPDTLPIGEDELEEYSACGRHDDTFPEDLLVAATETLRNRDDGTTVTPVSSQGCLRFYREMAAGALVSAEFRVLTGEIVYAFGGEEIAYGARFVTLARWERDASGTLLGSIDMDDDMYEVGDDFAEVRTEEREGYYRVTRYNPASREVEWQLTQDRSAVPALQTTEELREGELSVTDRTVLDFEAEAACGDEALDCSGNRTACDPATIATLEASLARALARGTTCMAGLTTTPDGSGSYDSDVWQRLQALKNMWTQQHNWTCMPAGCSCAHWCEGCGPMGEDQIDIGFTDWSTRPSVLQLGTLFHEFMHGVIGGHLDVVVNSNIGDGASRRDRLMRRYVDRVDACEAYCFADAPTRCACATCLDRRTCDQPCSGLATCREDDCSSGSGGCVPIMSEAVGAACVSTNTAGEETAVWHATMADCRSSGCEGSTGSSCRSYNRSCETGCE